MTCTEPTFECKPRADGSCAYCWTTPVEGTCPALVRMKNVYDNRHNPNPPQAEGLGDKVEKALKKLGITEEWFIEVKVKFGRPPTCGCARRKRWLNKVSAWWQEAKRAELPIPTPPEQVH